MHRSVYVLGMFAVALVTACDADALGPGEPSVVTALIEGSVTGSYSGTGYFMTLPDARRPAAPSIFLLQSRGAGDARHQGFELFRAGAGIPQPGVYDLTRSGGAAPEFSARFTHSEGAVTYIYSAQSGEVEITAISEERIDGVFHFIGTLTGTCRSLGSSVTCSVSAAEPDGPEVHVSGSFQASRRR